MDKFFKPVPIIMNRPEKSTRQVTLVFEDILSGSSCSR
jgi:hypothetical protein